MKVSLLISTYNRPEALRLVLESAFVQTRLPDEIVIGDDGSREPTRLLIEEMKAKSPVPIIHVWHQDDGFRLAQMRNKSVAEASGEYMIEIDGDVIMHRRFVEDHLAFACPGCYLKGGRANLGPELTDRMCKSGKLRKLRFWTKGYESKPENALRIPWLARYLAPRYRRNRETALGCNMSFFKDDFIAVNGYDEFFEGWGGEDIDFGHRLQKYGLQKRHLKFAALLYHLWHEDKYMYNKEKNFAYYERDNKPYRVKEGVDQYLNIVNNYD